MVETPREPQDPELANPPGPVSIGERITAIDTLRGVAVLGILAMNIYAFAMPYPAYMNPLQMGGTEWYNLGTWFFTHLFFDQKFMTIFSLLFGAGIIVMWERSAARQAPLAPIFYRRQVWLLAIGALHAYGIWFGDILFSYALVGMLVYFFRQQKPVNLIVLGVLLLSVAPLLSLTSSAYVEAVSSTASDVALSLAAEEEITVEQRAAKAEWDDLRAYFEPDKETLNRELQAYRSSYAEIVVYRAPQVVDMQINGMLFFTFWRVGGLMLLGMALLKLNVLTGRRDDRFYRNMALIGYGIGLPVMLFSATVLEDAQWDELFNFGTGSLPNYVGSISVAMGHIAAVMLLVRSGLCASLTTRLSSVGRMALTNYLMHSVVMTTIFYGYGLGLYGEIPRAAQMLFVAGMVGVQLWLSPLWLRSFRFGPAEWLWRSLTYWRLQPMRIHSVHR